MRTRALGLVGVVLVLSVGLAAAQPATIDGAEQQRVIAALATVLEQQYVFPDVARKMTTLVRSRLEAGGYRAISDPQAFAELLTEDLRSVSHDRHLRVMFAPDRIREERTRDEQARRAIEAARQREQRFSNYGFREARLLPGNIGYLKFDGFSDAQGAFAVAVGAMAFLANSDALIIDLRDNGGGSPTMIQVLSSYLFDDDPRHLNSFYDRRADTTEQTWTLPYVPGTRLPGVPVLVLTSSRTFSGAEEFTYNLKNMKRATIVGETTGGGAHPTRFEVLTDAFAVGVPFARAINPISHTNWEGTGVEPDVKVAAGEALATAQVLALEKLAAGTEDARLKATYQWALEGQRARLSPPALEEAVLRSYAGTYGPRVLTFESGALYYQRAGGRRMKMLPMTDDTFQFDEVPAFRLKVLRKDGQVVGVEGRYQDGTTDTSPKTP